VGGIKEVVVPEITGLLVPPADPLALAEAINRVLRDRDWARRLGLAGRKRVEDHFSWTAIAETTKKMYQQLLDERERASGQSLTSREEAR
jgi:glycosyltransferase involved in cell wall biosynthesis